MEIETYILDENRKLSKEEMKELEEARGNLQKLHRQIFLMRKRGKGLYDFCLSLSCLVKFVLSLLNFLEIQQV